ncbi:MAG: hypothetical protein R6W96_01050 [Clostridia bacterium]
MKKSLAILMVVALTILMAGCKISAPAPGGQATPTPQATDPSQATNGEDLNNGFTPLPEEWLRYPGAKTLDSMPYDYEIDFRNMKVTSRSWSLLAPDDVPPGREGWLKVLEYYDSQAALRNDFEQKEDSQGTYVWGAYELFVDGDTDIDDDDRFNIWLRLEKIEPIDPDKPVT